MKKHIIFDLDGTLINSFPVMAKAWEKVSDKFNLNIPFQNYKKFTGLPFNIIMEKFGLSSICDDIKKVYFNETRKRSQEIQMIDGSEDLIYSLKEKGFFVSIITSKPRKSFDSIKNLIPKEVDFILCADDTSFSKPNKNVLNFLTDKFPDKKNNLLYVGDTIFDLQFSINCQIDFIFFSNNNTNKFPKNLVNKFNMIDNLNDIKSLVHKF